MNKKTTKYTLGMLIVVFLFSLTSIPYLKHVRPVQVLEGNGDCVILLHGLGRLSSSMNPIAEYLNESEFMTVNIDYPSTKYDIKTLSKSYLEPAISKYCANSSKINFVTHSLGGIIVRHYLANNSLENLGKVIMLAPPNKGSELADYLKKIEIVNWIMGPALSELGTDSSSMPLNISDSEYNAHIIAGNKSSNFLFSNIIPGDDDGKVAVENTKFKNMKSFLLVSENHTYIMGSEEVKGSIKNFLEE